MGISLCLTAIRVADIDRSAKFYSLLGLVFVKHSHGEGPLHYASEEAGVLFEIYPGDAENPISAATRIGFAVPNTDDAVAALVAGGAQVVTPTKDSIWGRRAVIVDPDGYRVELLQKPNQDFGRTLTSLQNSNIKQS